MKTPMSPSVQVTVDFYHHKFSIFTTLVAYLLYRHVKKACGVDTDKILILQEYKTSVVVIG